MYIVHALARTAAIGVFSLAAACGSTETEAAQTAFANPDLAFAELVEAARNEGTDALGSLFGPDVDLVLGSSDPVAARNDLDVFLVLYEEQHQTVTGDDGSCTLVVGDVEWPFPIPVIEGDDGWTFDLARGLDEIVDRRIGRNELAAIDVCRAIGDAQAEYWSLSSAGTRTYAQKFISDPGERNGLHWSASTEGEQSPLGALIARAADDGYELNDGGEPTPYHGYHYALLTAQGPSARGGAKSFIVDGRMTSGFAVVAWPARYHETGVMTFLMDRRGIVFESDLGDDTAEIAGAMEAFDPGSNWSVCHD